MKAVMGAGAFGTALAISLAKNGPVLLWARDAEHARQMVETRENVARLPGVTLTENIQVVSDLKALNSCQEVLVAVPTQKLRAALSDAKAHLENKSVVACCKGVELRTQLSPTQIIQDVVPTAKPAVLTGPSFAADIARGLPTALTLACADDALGQQLQATLNTPTLRIYRTTDVVGAELGGALKNVMAIACGAAIGAGLGESARAALVTRGFAEMQRMAQRLGAQRETLAGLSGFGDLTLTCTSPQSRNFRFGQSIGRGEDFDPTVTVEGASTAVAVLERARKLGIDMPITAAVVGLVNGKLRVGDAMDMLLSRPLKEEKC